MTDVLVYNLTGDVNKKSKVNKEKKKKKLVSKLREEVTGRKIEKEIMEMSKIGKKVEGSSKPRTCIIQVQVQIHSS